MSFFVLFSLHIKYLSQKFFSFTFILLTDFSINSIIYLHNYIGKVCALPSVVKECIVKSKKLLTFIIVVAVLVVITAVFASVFAVRQIMPVYHSFDGGQMGSVKGAPTANDVLQFTKGQSILFLSKEEVINQLNEAFPEWHAIGIVKSFPNILEVHFVKRVAVVKVKIGGVDVFLDSFGFVVDAPTDEGVRLNVTSALEEPILTTINEKGQKLQFASDTNNLRLQYVLESMMALWQCKADIENIPTILGKQDNVFTFDEKSTTMTITTGVGAKIRIMDPSTTLTDKLINAFSVYCDESYDLQKAGVIINVYPDGKVTRADDSVIAK